MKFKKMLGTLIAINMCFISLQPVYGQALNMGNNEVESQKIQVSNPKGLDELMTKEALLTVMEGNPLYSHFSELVTADGDLQQVTWQLAGRIVCDYLGWSPVLLPPGENCADAYLGRLKVEGFLESQVPNPTTPLTNREWNLLKDKADSFLQGANKQTAYKTQIAKANSDFEEVPIGNMREGKRTLEYDSFQYPLFETADTAFVRLNDLKQMGLSIVAKENGLIVSALETMAPKATDGKKVEGIAKSQKASLVIGNTKTYSVKCGNEILVPVRALGSLFTLNMTTDSIGLSLLNENSETYVNIEDNKLINRWDRPIDVRLTTLYWDGKSVQTVVQEIKQLPQEATLELPQNYFSLINSQMKYITTLVDQVSYTGDFSEPVEKTYEVYDQYGQNNLSYFQAYEKGRIPIPESKPIAQKTDLFPDTRIIGTMKYSTGPLKKGEKVEVWAAEKGSHYTVIQKGKKVKIPWDSISIPSNPPVQKQAASKLQLEEHINSKGFTSKTNYLVWTDLHRQRTYVFTKKGDGWSLYKQMLCSTGNNKTPTPRGEYTLTSNVPAFGMSKGYMCKNAVGIFGDYLYHSIMFDKTGSYELSGVGRLGHQASSGCIRLSYEDSVWFYKNMPLGTKVWIN